MSLCTLYDCACTPLLKGPFLGFLFPGGTVRPLFRRFGPGALLAFFANNRRKKGGAVAYLPYIEKRPSQMSIAIKLFSFSTESRVDSGFTWITRTEHMSFLIVPAISLFFPRFSPVSVRLLIARKFHFSKSTRVPGESPVRFTGAFVFVRSSR